MTVLGQALGQTGIPSLVGWNSGNDRQNQDGIIRKAVAAAIYPFQLATSPTAIKAYLTAILFLSASFVLLSISTTAYAFFYYNYIPQTNLERPIFLQYDTEHYPYADIPFDTSALISQQPYDISIVLDMPRDPINQLVGNFMLDLSLYRGKENTQSTVLGMVNMEQVIEDAPLHRSRRPALMPYTSFLTTAVHKVIHLPLHMLASSHHPDSVTLTIPMFEEVEFARGKGNIPTYAKLIIQTQRPSKMVWTPEGTFPVPHIQVYSAKITFQVRFHGLRYLIYNHRILAFLIFTGIFYSVSISTVAIAWTVLAMVLHTYTSADPTVIKAEKNPTIKQEHDTSDPLRTESDFTIKPSKRISDDSEDNATVQEHTQGGTNRADITPQTPGAASAVSSQAQAQAQAQVQTADVSEEQADDEEEESEDEWDQLQRLRRRMEKDARERDRQRMLERDSGIGASSESDNRMFAAGGRDGSSVRRRSSWRSEDSRE